ncbi:MAG: peptidylprolyl isomerase [Pseudomonadota bacterium]
MRRVPYVVTAVFCAALMAAAGTALAQDEPTIDTVVASVDGIDITIGHMILARNRLPEEYQQLPPEVLFEGIREQLIQQTALAGAATDVPKRVELALENERRALIAGEVLNTVADEAVTDEAVQSAYDALYANAEPDKEFNASHILVETEEEALEIVTALEEGADFAQTARERSTGPSGPNGGNLGWFSSGRMVKPFEDAVVAMEVGGISAPVQTQFGWHVITLNDTRNLATPELEEVRAQLTQQVQREAADARVAELVEQAIVERAEEGTIDPNILNQMEILQQ